MWVRQFRGKEFGGKQLKLRRKDKIFDLFNYLIFLSNALDFNSELATSELANSELANSR
jgi:hypothetical protein